MGGWGSSVQLCVDLLRCFHVQLVCAAFFRLALSAHLPNWLACAACAGSVHPLLPAQAMDARRKQNERPLLHLLVIASVASAVLLSAVLYHLVAHQS